MCCEWAWPTRNPSFAFCDAQTDPAQRLEEGAGPNTCMRSASSYHAGGTRSLAYDVRHARHALGLVRIERGPQEQCTPCQPFACPFGGMMGSRTIPPTVHECAGIKAGTLARVGSGTLPNDPVSESSSRAASGQRGPGECSSILAAVRHRPGTKSLSGDAHQARVRQSCRSSACRTQV